MFLIDTNIWLERLLEQEKSNEVKIFFEKIDTSRFFISDFTLHSIGVILVNLKMASTYTQFIDDVFNNANIKLLSLSVNDLKEVIKIVNKTKLDFDDAYQQYLAKKFNLALVTFDSDFNKSGYKTFTPKEALTFYRKEN